jgi:triosephosphate isomerase (TIM)
MRKPFVAGNWKMNTNSHSSVDLAKAVASGSSDVAGDAVTVAVIPPFVYLQSVAQAVSSQHVAVGAQDIYFEEKGAFTGEVSPAMLKDVGCTYVLCGHSERRHVIGETDELINKKVVAAIGGGLLPILCVGELLEQRDAGQTEAVVAEQVKAGLAGLSADKLSAVTIAYEPVWAIGTGQAASSDNANNAIGFIRQTLSRLYNEPTAQETLILYGGSVTPDNTAELMSQPEIDGALVGGASLKSGDFLSIVKQAAEIKE